MIEFHLIRFMNFLSTGDRFSEVDFQKTDNTLIVGKNGRGKSQICDALCYALFNKPFREINLPQLVNSDTQANLLVEVEFSVRGSRYKVCRGMKPKVFEIWKNGVMLNQPGDNTDFQIILERDILQLTYKAFTQIVILGKANYTPFMKLKTSERRAVVEDLLDLTVFSSMASIVKQRMADNKDAMKENQFILNQTENIIIQKQKSISVIEQNKEALIEEAESRKTQTEEEIEEIEKEIAANDKIIADAEEQLNQLAGLEDQLEIAEKAATQINRKILANEKDQAFFEDHKSCTVCKQDITPDFAKRMIDNLDQEYRKDCLTRAKVDKKIDELNEKIDALSPVQTARGQAKNANITLRARLNSKIAYIRSQDEDIEKMRAKTDSSDGLKEEVESLLKKRDRLIAENKTLVQQRVVIETAIQMLKDDGIKNRMIQGYLPNMNNMIQENLKALELPVQFTIDGTFKEKVLNRNMESYTYNSFSEGEKSRIELAMLLSWRDVAKSRNSTSTNILFLDEVFDGSMDDEGNEDMQILIENMRGKCHIFVITHNTDSYVERFDRTIILEKKGGFSVMKEQ